MTDAAVCLAGRQCNMGGVAMKYLVVTAHPLPGSLCRTLAQHVIHRLAGLGHDVRQVDLYDQAFAPALTPQERGSYYAATYDAAQISQMAEDLSLAEGLVLVFPTWWFGFPAILKGWFDRVWAPGIAFDHGADFGPITPKLSNLKHTVVVTTLGSPWWVDWLVMRRPVKKVIKRGLLGACTTGCKLNFLSLYASEALTPGRFARFCARIDKALDK